MSNSIPSTTSMSMPKVLESSTVMTPSLPTFSMASAIFSPISAIARGDGADVLDLVEGLDLLGILLDLLDQCVDGLVHARADGDGIGAGGHILETVANHDIGKQRGGGGTVTGDVIGLDGGLADELGAHVLDLVLELDLLGDGHTVVGDERGAEAALAGDVAALGTKRDLDGIGEFGCAGGKRAARIGTKANVLSSH